MEHTLVNKSDQIDIGKLLKILFAHKWFIIIPAVVVAIGVAIWVIQLPNIYKSEATLYPTEESQGGGLSAIAGKLGGLASLAGVNLSSGGSDKVSLALELMKSRDFLISFLERHELKIDLMATKGWDRENDKLIIDEDEYSINEKKWVRDVSFPKRIEPSNLELYNYFIENNLSVSKSKDSGLIVVGVKHYSPTLAKKIVELLVGDINQYMRSSDIDEAEKSIHYLNDTLNNTGSAELKGTLFQLIEQQQQKKMLATVREEYVFKTVDSAFTPEVKVAPNRLMLLLFSSILTVLISVFLILVKYAFRKDSIN
ncbi:hypothetical protein TK45_02915 [Bowmanella sp. JS7-9]|nr:hypothetical protein TK45_02915 [Bowmanella sp. JS7-9]